MRIALFQTTELHQIQQFQCLGANRCGRRALRLALHPQSERDVVEHGHVLEQRIVLEYETDPPLPYRAPRHVLAAEQNLAVIGKFETGDGAQQRGFAGTGWPEQCDQFSRAHGEAEVDQRRKSGKTLVYVANFDIHFGTSMAV